MNPCFCPYVVPKNGLTLVALLVMQNTRELRAKLLK